MTIATGIALPPWCTRLLAELQDADRRAQALCASLTPQQLGWNPRPGGWSIGQCLEHLRISGAEYLPVIKEALAIAPAGFADEIRPGWFGRLFIDKFIDPETAKGRAKAPGKIRPGPTVPPDVLERFLAGNRELRAMVQGAARIDVNRVRFRNPFVGPIRFTVGTGFEILSRHERRHLGQAERVTQSAGFPAS